MDDHESCNQVISFLQALNKILEDLQSKFRYYYYYSTIDVNSPQINCLLELENRAPTVLFSEASILSNLNHLKILINNLKSNQHYTLRSFIQRGLISKQFSRIALLIQKEIQLCFDKENISNLIKLLQESSDDEKKLRALDQFEGRISDGFDLELQNLILEASLFSILELILCNDSFSSAVREKAGSVIAALARFNRSVFVGNLLMGYTIPALVLMGSIKSLEVLISLVKSIKGHLVNEMELNGQIPKIIGLLSSEDLHVRLMAMHCLLEMAYFGKREVVESMINCGFVEKLVLLQRVEPEFDISEGGQMEEMKNRELCVGGSSDGAFSGSIARFAIQVEVGEGMEKREKKEVKMEILRRARAACVSEAEAATVVAEVLWGSHP